MKLAVISVVEDSWSGVPAFLSELHAALEKQTEFEPTVWLIDDGADAKPDSWQTLELPGRDLHVIELQGHQGRDRALVTALGYLICEREEGADAFLLLDVRDHRQLRQLGPLFETHLHHPEAVALAPGGPARGGLGPRFSHRLSRAFLRSLSGERLVQSPAILLPASAAEALCHSCFGASHVESALRRLRVGTIASSMPAGSCGLNLAGAASVFRERIFERAFRLASALFLASLLVTVFAAAELVRGARAPAIVLALAALVAAMFGGVALLSLFFGVFTRSLEETRRWTPALDAPLLVREVTRVRRQPYAVTGAG